MLGFLWVVWMVFSPEKNWAREWLFSLHQGSDTVFTSPQTNRTKELDAPGFDSNGLNKDGETALLQINLPYQLTE